MHDEIIPDEDGGVTLTGSGGGAAGISTFPGHDFEVENVQIVVIIFAIPASKDKHARAVDQIRSVVESGERGTGTFRSLVPRHCDRVESMEIFEDFAFVAFSSKDDNPLPSQHSRVAKPLRGRRPLNPRLNPPRTIQVQHMRVIQVRISISLASIKMSAEENNRRPDQRRRVAASRRGRYSLDLRVGPQPFALFLLHRFISF